MDYIEPIAKLINEFSKLPSVGQKTAQRYALKVLNMTDEQARAFAAAILDAKAKVKLCSVCGNYTDVDPCEICAKRDRKVICVVKEAKDVLAIEKIRDYKGVYHVLGGVLSPMENVGVKDIRIRELMERLTGDVSEIIIATNPDVEGEATASYLARLIKPMGIKVTRLAQGIAIGSELQYADEVTLLKALENRKEM